MSLEDIMISETSRSQEISTVESTPGRHVKQSSSWEWKLEWCLPGDWGAGETGSLVWGVEFPICKMKSSGWRVASQQCKCTVSSADLCTNVVKMAN